MTITAWFTIGIPAFILSLAPNNERAQPHFVRRVMTAALPSGLIVGTATFVCYLLAYEGHDAGAAQQTQASTAALITLLMSTVWVLAVVARPYSWWRVLLVAGAGSAYVAIFSVPLAREKFMIDPSNVALTTTALTIGLLAAGAIEVSWWVQGRLIGDRRRLWRENGRMGFLDKAKDLLAKNADKVDTAIDKAADVVDSKTQGKYKDKVDKVQEAAKKAVRQEQTARPRYGQAIRFRRRPAAAGACVGLRL